MGRKDKLRTKTWSNTNQECIGTNLLEGVESKEVKHNKMAEGKVLPTCDKNTKGKNRDTAPSIRITGTIKSTLSGLQAL